MSNEIQHRSRADNNESFFLMIENVDIILQFSDWKYIALYYSALHFGDAYLAKKGIDRVIDHRDRDLLVIAPFLSSLKMLISNCVMSNSRQE